MHSLEKSTNSFNAEDSGLHKNNIFFSEPYHKIAGEENYQNYELNKVLSNSIYENIKNNFDYLKETQYNSHKNNICETNNLQYILGNIKLKGNKCNKILANKENLHNNTEFIKFKDTNISPHLKTHNILNNKEDSIEFHQHIPSLDTEKLIEYNSDIKKIKSLDEKEEIMYDPRFNEYPPMNGFGYNHLNTSNGNGFYANTCNKELANLTMQQQNMHGRNNLMFEEGNVPYGLYDQSNFTGTNSLMCGNVPLNDPKTIYRGNGINEPHYNNFPVYNGMGYNYPVYRPQYNPNMKKNPMNGGYFHECHYSNNANSSTSKSSCGSVVGKGHKEEMCRKNISKVKKGDIDINIETSSSNRKGVTIDLNIGVGN